jgi:undecaprenyl diphosphate synthase
MHVPHHIAIIPDGNRRFAKKNGKIISFGHDQGVETFKLLLKWAKKKGVKELSCWAMSTENLKREIKEVEYLFEVFRRICDMVISKKEDFENARISFYGSLEKLPHDLFLKIKKVEELTKDNQDLKLNLLIAYGGRQELLQAAKRIAQDAVDGKINPDNLTEAVFAEKLYVHSDPDLIIRTGHACLSGLLPWQTVYSEIVFLEDKLWPEMTEEDFEKCVEIYAQRIRNFGK